MNARISLALILAISLLLLGCTQSSSTNPDGNGTDGGTTLPPAAEFSLSQVAVHNSASDCWLAIHGKVYNVTPMVSGHPGGEAILQGCGKDATDLFETRPMGSNTPHSDRARTNLDNFFVGDLAS